MKEQMTEQLTIGDVTYTLRARLGWFEQQAIDDKAFRLFTDGKSLSAAGDIDGIENLEIVINTAAHNLARLEARLAGVNRRVVREIPPAHAALLIQRIEELEREQVEELAQLDPANPTAPA